MHGTLLAAVFFLFIPLYLALVTASQEGVHLMQAPMPIWPGKALFYNLKSVMLHGLQSTGGQPVWQMLLNSFVMATVIAVGKIVLALFSAFALVYFDLPLKGGLFALILSTMMLPVEVRIMPTFQVVASFGWLNTFKGLSLPLIASATATFFFYQLFKSIPKELVDAAKLDGAGPLRFFKDILLPLSKAQAGSLFIILFIYGWNQYLWPLVVTTDNEMTTIVMGMRYLVGVADQLPQWHVIMCIALIALTPPCLIMWVMRRWFERGLIH
ncbi:MAG: sn-glycerol-3-phosphate ABC transporter permease UgpE [Legionella sp.]|nr:sn-glycerol-3-phosphate ABC transporter permease UgpE [Legionella sp.]